MKVLFVASECAPFIKTGGLADVIGAVPKALAAEGAQVRVLLPAYPALADQLAAGTEVMRVDALFGGPARVVAVAAKGIDLLLLDAPHLFDRPGNIYLDSSGADWHDNHHRFAALSWVGARIGTGALADWAPDVVNAHDWQAALVPLYLRMAGGHVPTVLTIHNIAFQGVFPSSTLATLDLPDFAWRQDVGEFWGKFSFLKCGLMLADRVTTVSPTYAAELMSPDFGMGLDGVMRDRRDVLSGIVNGIDLDVWNPETDPVIPQTYTSRTLRKKAVNTAALRERFGLEDSTGPLFCVISRLTTQKGLDLLLEVLPALIDQGAQLALLGSGDKGMEHAYADAARRHAGQIGAIIGYDEDLSHLMQAGADGILVPSRFEPCGLTQLYALRYGTVPVVARTGGLADTIVDANIAAIDTGCGTGVQFTPVTALALEQAIARACALFQRKELWSGLQKRGMKQPVGWNASALAYLTLFKGLKNN